MDAEERALLAAIIANPDEDTPRLVYADWLQERDRPERAEFIRLSIELANLRYGTPGAETRYWQLRAARDPLITRFHKQWEQEFAARFPATRNLWFGFRRGFVEDVMCSVKYFLDNAEQLFEEAPIRLLGPWALTPVTVRRLTASAPFRRLTGLHTIERECALALFSGSALEITALDFSRRFLFGDGFNEQADWDAVALRMAAHGGLQSVKRINLECCGIGGAGGLALAEASHLNPEVLNLLGNVLSATARHALRERFGSRVWLDPTDRNGFPFWF
jgi:uncharacterized protein (TIGR02996 family)